MVWYSHLLKNFPQFVVIYTVKHFSVINKGEVDVFLEFSCFFDDPTDVGNLISGSSVFSKSNLNIWRGVKMDKGIKSVCFINIVLLEHSHAIHLHVVYGCSCCTARQDWVVITETVTMDLEKAEEQETKLPTSVGS